MSKNPFAQSDDYQNLTIDCKREAVGSVEAALEDLALSMASFEREEEAGEILNSLQTGKLRVELKDGGVAPVDAEHWRIDMVLESSAARAEAESRLALLQKSGVGVERWQGADLEMQDWAAEVQKNFPPLSVGRFYIHGSHIAALTRPWVSLRIDAGCAFGTGEHATTSGCLRALEWAARFRRYQRVLDLGCGTGILAIAAKKLWPEARIRASDMDAVSVRVAARNAEENGVPGIDFIAARGVGHHRLRQRYELILANILARPLVRLAGEMVASLEPGGMLILSGLLNWQEREVLNAYQRRGMRLAKCFRQDGWSALVLVKPGSAAE